MINDKIESAKLRAEALKNEYEELYAVLINKKAEIDGLASGYQKYEEDQAMKSQMEKLIGQRINELKAISGRIEELGKNYKQAKEELNRLFELVKAEMREKKIQKESPVIKIAKTSADRKMIDLAVEKKAPIQSVVKPILAVKPQPEPVKKEEIKTAIPETKRSPSADIYDKAAREAKAQEEFIKKMSRSSKDYGAA